MVRMFPQPAYRAAVILQDEQGRTMIYRVIPEHLTLTQEPEPYYFDRPVMHYRPGPTKLELEGLLVDGVEFHGNPFPQDPEEQRSIEDLRAISSGVQHEGRQIGPGL